MTNAVEAAIAAYVAERSDSAIREMERTLVENSVLVPTAAEATEMGAGRYDVPVICLRTTSGDGAIPAFTTIDQMLNWRPEGCKYITVRGKSLLEMALGMPDVSRVVINVDGTPRGAIPRSEFVRLIALG